MVITFTNRFSALRMTESDFFTTKESEQREQASDPKMVIYGSDPFYVNKFAPDVVFIDGMEDAMKDFR